MFLILVCFSVYFFYLFFVQLLFKSWIKIVVFKCNKSEHLFLKATIVISLKNEEQNILNLLYSIENQSINSDFFEVILIDDHSTDNSLLCINKYILSSKINITLCKANNYGKKEAIKQAISIAKNEIIICTDADCIVPYAWIETWILFFQQTKSKFGFGLVSFNESKSFFSKMNDIEFASLVGSGAATWALEIPTMCNGANIAYFKSVFIDVNGFEGIDNQPSGDDELLMHKIFKNHPSDVGFLKSKLALVVTQSPPNLRNFYHQRLRWASKWENYQATHVKIVALMIFFTNLFTVIVFVSVFIDFNFYNLVFYMLLQFMRMMIEYRFLNSILNFTDKKLNLGAFLVLFTVYPFYVVLFGLGSRFLNYNWKN